MTHIRRIRLVLPKRMAGIAPAAAREIAERFVDASHDNLGGVAPQQTLTMPDTGQSPSQIGLSAARQIKTSGGRS